ncbi:hypothetical protein K469DRAFT_702575 [Zopfia rhizophila CBS 207.26]|uniref:PH domain-containing protein n=1 Tax=Zopfia rhizophila CBS 207.26 TaxID=1314779 RepID=A0A6A6EAN2_9PEZI|nr:hypothetical protein K469DRAFT_702575 [Zopfia rhizophila CBS 207.26]
MTQLVAKYAAKKLLSKEMDKYKSKDVAGQYDPFYELTPHPRKPGKMKKVKKQIPAYIPPHDAEILARARKRAYMLDVCLFNFMGIRFGWSSVIGIVPAVGDVLDTLLSIMLIMRMNRIEGGLGYDRLTHMIFNIAIDFIIGLVPFVGDLADASFKCNSKNVRLLEQHLDKKYKPKSVIDAEKDIPPASRPGPATVYEDFSEEEEERRGPSYDDRHNDVRAPKRAYSGRKERIPDEEMGLPRHGSHRHGESHKSSRHGTKNSRRR